MANIAIVNYCNLKCPYCFADDMIHEKALSISLDDYREILNFLSRTPKNHVGIIGGEPTLHPHFKDILKETNKYCKELNTDATLFTNGINLEKFMPEMSERIHILLNVNSPEEQGFENWQKLLDVMDHMADLCWFDQRVNIGCNVHPGREDYKFIWDLVDKYHIEHIRCSVVSPGGQFKNLRNDKEGYYEKMKPIYLDFCKEAIKHHCLLDMDCGHIPICYFDMEERALIQDACTPKPMTEFCDPVVDITPEFKATACFGSYDPIDIRDFHTLFELERYLLLKKTYPKSQANCTGKCTTCKKHELAQCQGGCLGFAIE